VRRVARGGPRPRDRGPRSRPEDLSGVVVQLVDSTGLPPRARAGLVRRFATVVSDSARTAGAVAVGSGRWLADAVIETAPHLPVRDAETLSAHHNGLVGDGLAWAVIESAARATGAVGAAGGLLASVEFTTSPPLLLTAPVQVAAETLAVVAIEVKLIAELHEIYRRPAVGTPAVRAAAYLGAWTRGRAIDPERPGIPVTLTGAARRSMQYRLVRRAGKNSITVVPFLAGAVAGASLNSRETKKLGRRLVADMGGRV
jgi:hypothetical protein